MASLGSPKSIEAELAVLNDPLTAEERVHLVKFIAALQTSETVDDFFKLHRDLLIRYLARQRVREQEIARERDAARAQLSELVKRDPRPIDEIHAAQALLARIEHADRVQAALSAHLRAIADGLVWKAVQYDRAAIQVFGRGTRVDRLADDGVGLQAELEALGELWEQERAFTVHNDLTTVLRHGDLTTLRPEEGRVEVREIKAGRRAGSQSKQIARLTAATELINHGLATDPQTGATLTLHRLPVEYRTSLDLLAGAIDEARVSGYATQTIGTMQQLTVIDYRVWAGREDELGEHHRAVTGARGWGPAQKTFDWMSSMRRIRDRRHSFGSLAPLSIFPAPAEDLADLILGPLEMHTSVRFDLLEEAFKARGMTATVDFPNGNDRFLVAHRGATGVEIPAALREQMMFELMTPKTLLDMVEAMLDIIERSPLDLASSTVGCDESAAWG